MKYLIILQLLFIGCGGSKDPVGDNENLPAIANSTETFETGTNCLSDCSPADELRFDFGVDTRLVFMDCKVLDFKVFPAGGSFLAVYMANCLEGVQVYSLRFSSKGEIEGASKVLSRPCLSQFKDVKAFASERVGDETFVAYSCATTSTQSKTWFHGISSEPSSIETFNTPYYDNDLLLKLSWNPESKVFAVVSKRGLVRVTAEGKQMGGTVPLNLSKSVHSVSVIAGQWLILSRDPTPYWTSKTYCSKVLMNGQLACDKVEWNSTYNALLSESLSVQATTSYNSNVAVGLSSFHPESCSVGPVQLLASQNVSDFSLQSAGVVKEGLGYFLSSSQSNLSGSLFINLFEMNLAGKTLSRLAIADGDLRFAQAIVKEGKIVVFYLDLAGSIHFREGHL